MRRIDRALALLLILPVLTLHALAGDALPQRWHGMETMEELERLNYDQSAFLDTLCAKIQEKAAGGRDDLDMEDMLRELRELYLLQDTGLAVASIRSDQDVTDQAANALYLRRLEQSYDVEERTSDTVQAVLNSPYAGLIDEADPVFSMFLWETEPLTDQERELYYTEQALIDDYYAAANGAFTADVAGKTYTEDELYDAWWDGEISDNAYDRALLDIARAENEVLAPIYLELVKIRRAQANFYGFSDYAAMQDEYAYDRDYSVREVKTFSKYVKQYIVPLAERLYQRIQGHADAGAYDTYFTEEELLENLRLCAGNVSEELLPAYQYMTEHGFYDIAPGDKKADGAYTTILSRANAPFLLMKPLGDGSDLSALIHEFGHYNAYFCSGDIFAYNIDLSEIHSQALELLALDSYDAVFGETAEAERDYALYNLLASLIDGCMMDELERYAYGADGLTAEQLNVQYMALLKEYGYRDAGDEAVLAYDWVMTGHLFSQPLYYISYGVSAAAALTLWNQSLEDREGAVETYLRLVVLGESGDFFDTLAQVGLNDPLSEDSLRQIADSVELQTGLSSGFPAEGDSQGGRVLVAGISVAAVACAQLVIWAASRRKKRASG